MNVCDMRCSECKFSDCINDSDMTMEERIRSNEFERALKKEFEPQVIPELGMQRYIHNRPDKEAYVKARNAEYEAKRKGRKDRVAYKKRYYRANRERVLEYQKNFYQEHQDEKMAYQRAYYEANKEEINRRRREKRKERRQRENSQDQ